MKYLFFLFVAVFTFSGESFSQSPRSEFGKEFLPFWETAKKQALELAELIPTEKYAYVPAKGGRSVEQMFLHIAYEPHYLSKTILEKIKIKYEPYDQKTGVVKTVVIDMMKQSFDQVRNMLVNITEEELKEEVNVYGLRLTKKQLFYYLTDHNTSHTGKLKLVVRMLGMNPPEYKFLDK